MEFKSFQKIDAHLHFNVPNTDILQRCRQENFNLVTVNVEFPEFGSIDKQFKVASDLQEKSLGSVRFISSFVTDNWHESSWFEQTIAAIRQAQNRGAIGVKIWKNIGMVVRDSEGYLLSIDDARLDPLFDFLEKENIPLMMHQAEPKNCWLPLDKISMRYDREFYKAHPEQHMFRYPQKPDYDFLIASRNRRLEKHPDLVTVQAHLGSMEWNVEQVARFLDAFPNTYVDTAARINHLMLQAQKDRKKVRDFFIRYQDRILYATDFFVSKQTDPAVTDNLTQQWYDEWRFLSGCAEMRSKEFKGSFKGLYLPDTVLEKIYFKNALRAFPKLSESAKQWRKN